MTIGGILDRWVIESVVVFGILLTAVGVFVALVLGYSSVKSGRQKKLLALCALLAIILVSLTVASNIKSTLSSGPDEAPTGDSAPEISATDSSRSSNDVQAVTFGSPAESDGTFRVESRDVLGTGILMSPRSCEGDQVRIDGVAPEKGSIEMRLSLEDRAPASARVRVELGGGSPIVVDKGSSETVSWTIREPEFVVSFTSIGDIETPPACENFYVVVRSATLHGGKS